MRFLLNAAAAGAAGGEGRRALRAPATARAGRTSACSGPHEVEVRFLAGCLALPDTGRECLAAIGEEYFASAATRRAYALVRAALRRRGGGKMNRPDGVVAGRKTGPTR